MKRGDVLICVTNKIYTHQNNLIIGRQYIVDDFIEMSEKLVVSVQDSITNDWGLYEDKYFIPLDVWREFQLRKVLE